MRKKMGPSCPHGLTPLRYLRGNQEKKVCKMNEKERNNDGDKRQKERNIKDNEKKVNENENSRTPNRLLINSLRNMRASYNFIEIALCALL